MQDDRPSRGRHAFVCFGLTVKIIDRFGNAFALRISKNMPMPSGIPHKLHCYDEIFSIDSHALALLCFCDSKCAARSWSSVLIRLPSSFCSNYRLCAPLIASRTANCSQLKPIARAVAIEIAAAVNDVHQAGKAILNITPTSILFSHDGQVRFSRSDCALALNANIEEALAILAEFSAADKDRIVFSEKFAEATLLDETKVDFAKRRFMPPEFAMNTSELDLAAIDVYMLGCCMKLLIGNFEFVDAMTAENPAHRPRIVDAIAQLQRIP
jgi:hypothetical protein